MPEIPRIIDIRKELRASNSWVFRSLPGFIITAVENLIRQDEMNSEIHRHHGRTGIQFINAVLEGWNVKLEIKGSVNIPGSGRFIFVANHPMGGIDAMAFLSMIHRSFPDVISPSNEHVMVWFSIIIAEGGPAWMWIL